jgi:alanine dehydrogenase
LNVTFKRSIRINVTLTRNPRGGIVGIVLGAPDCDAPGFRSAYVRSPLVLDSAPRAPARIRPAVAGGTAPGNGAGRTARREGTLVKVGIPSEVKNHEYRVAITPAGVHELTGAGHEVFVEKGAGIGSSIPDDDLISAGAKILPTADDVWGEADLVLKVKEPVPEEYHRMRRGQILFTYLHLAASFSCTQAILDSGIDAVAYETVQTPDRALPLLAPMSEVAGRMAPQVGAHCLEREAGGRGVLMGGVSGVYAAKVVVLGAGVSGMNAAAIALGMQAEVLLMDNNIDKLRAADRIYQGHLQTVASNTYEVERACIDADLVIGAVLIPGAKAPTLVSDELVGRMKPGSVLVDIAVDQGGCFESTRPTTHDNPTFTVARSIFYCVANMPGAVPNTSTHALTNVTLPYVMELAGYGLRDAVSRDAALALGVNAIGGKLTYPPVAEAHNLPVTPLAEALS